MPAFAGPARRVAELLRVQQDSEEPRGSSIQVNLKRAGRLLWGPDRNVPFLASLTWEKPASAEIKGPRVFTVTLFSSWTKISQAEARHKKVPPSE